MDRHERFKRLPREQQRASLIRRLRASRRECEQIIRDADAFDDILRARGEQPLPRDERIPGLLAWIDQRLAEVESATA